MACPTQEELIQRKQQALLSKSISAIQARLDTVAREKGYGDAQTAPSVSARSYAGYDNPFQAECILYGQWCSTCWGIAYQILAEVQTGTRVAPTIDELITMLPTFNWE